MDTYSAYGTSRKAPLLTKTETAELSRRARKGDLKARNRLVEANMRLVMRFAGDYACDGLEYEDLVQEGSIGLMKAAEMYRPEFGSSFATYAGYWIRSAISKAIASKGRAIRLPDYAQDILRRTEKAELESGTRLSDDEAAKAMGVSMRTMRNIRLLANPVASLDRPLKAVDDSPTLGELLPSDENPEEDVADSCMADMTDHMVAELPEPMRSVIILRYGLLGLGRQLTLEQTGLLRGVTKERTRQIEAKAIRLLRQKASLREMTA